MPQIGRDARQRGQISDVAAAVNLQFRQVLQHGQAIEVSRICPIQLQPFHPKRDLHIGKRLRPRFKVPEVVFLDG